MIGFKNIMNKNKIVLELKNVSKSYYIHHEKPTLVERLLNGKNEKFNALKGIGFSVSQGEKVGIIGPNGSGKTTLLKLISGIASPTSGTLKIDGKIVSLIDLEAGFHSDLNGIENIYLNGMILGMKVKEINAKIKSIIAFANIGKFIDAQLFTYSQGMKLRLGFSIALHADPDILILDENMSVGDENFKKQSYKKIKELFKENKTIIIASHDLEYIQGNCDRVILIKKGSVVFDGNPERAIRRYRKDQN